MRGGFTARVRRITDRARGKPRHVPCTLITGSFHENPRPGPSGQPAAKTKQSNRAIMDQIRVFGPLLVRVYVVVR